MPFEIIRDDITNVCVDAIVNTANPRPVIGSGVDAAIHAKAGPMLLAARKSIGTMRTGEACVTPGFRLPCKHVIHTVAPVWEDGCCGEAYLLRRCYGHSLRLALRHRCKSVAFPLISSGNYGFPKKLALQIAVETIRDFLENHEMQVYLVVFSKESLELSGGLIDQVRSFIDDAYVQEREKAEYSFSVSRDFDFVRERMEEPGEKTAEPETYRRVFECPELPPEWEQTEALFRETFDLEFNWDDDTDAETCQNEDNTIPVILELNTARSEFEEREKMVSTARLPRLDIPQDQEPGYGHVCSTESCTEESVRNYGSFSTSKPKPKQPTIIPLFDESELIKMVQEADAGFSETLLKLIDKSGEKDSEIYKRANVDRKLFSKIRNNPQYKPSKVTAVSFAIALQLNLEETRDFIGRAGYALSRSNKFDIIIEYFITHERYDIYEINLMLFEFDQSLLGA
jgi:O-acetyl-ADP-ribose deacetylase (regulator of RNase III)